MTVVLTRPGIYYAMQMHAGPDAIFIFTFYEDYDEDTETGTATDLTGVTLAAQGKDSAGTSVWSVTPTLSGTPTDGVVTLTIPAATTVAKKGLEGEWAMQVTWADTTTSYPIWGRFGISPIVLVG